MKYPNFQDLRSNVALQGVYVPGPHVNEWAWIYMRQIILFTNTHTHVSDKKLRPCCACPETKQVRDQCIVENGEEKCMDLIEAHKECMRKHGFKI